MTKNIMIVGVGGQGTLLTSRILGGVMENAGYEVKVSEVHGMAQRGGSVVTFVRYGKDVAEPIVEEGQADVLIAFERLEALRYANFLKKDGVLIVNDWRIDPISVVMGTAQYPENIIENLEKTHTVYRINAMEEALRLGNSRVFNNIVLGMAAKHRLIFSGDRGRFGRQGTVLCLLFAEKGDTEPSPSPSLSPLIAVFGQI